MISNALNLILMIVLIIFNMINIGIWPMVILALLIIANSIFMVYKTVDVKKSGSIINWTDDKIHQSNFYVFE